MTIEEFLERFPGIHQRGETITLKRGSFGIDGRLIRIASIEGGGVLLEMHGQTQWISGKLYGWEGSEKD